MSLCNQERCSSWNFYQFGVYLKMLSVEISIYIKIILNIRFLASISFLRLNAQL
jgi:hypothetical protein